jgi:hypothetical protein
MANGGSPVEFFDDVRKEFPGAEWKNMTDLLHGGGGGVFDLADPVTDKAVLKPWVTVWVEAGVGVVEVGVKTDSDKERG